MFHLHNWSIAEARKHLISSAIYHYCFILSVLKHVRSASSGRMLHATPWILGKMKGDMHFRSTAMTPVANNLSQEETAAISQEQLKKAMSNLLLQ